MFGFCWWNRRTSSVIEVPRVPALIASMKLMVTLPLLSVSPPEPQPARVPAATAQAASAAAALLTRRVRIGVVLLYERARRDRLGPVLGRGRRAGMTKSTTPSAAAETGL